MRQSAETPAISRQQRVMAARAAFGQGNSIRTVSSRNMEEWHSREVAGPEEDWHSRRGYGLLRFMTSAMLLMVLMVAFHMGFSYEGFDRAYVQERLNDETSWNRLEKQVQQVYLSLEKQWRR